MSTSSTPATPHTPARYVTTTGTVALSAQRDTVIVSCGACGAPTLALQVANVRRALGPVGAALSSDRVLATLRAASPAVVHECHRA